MLQILHD